MAQMLQRCTLKNLNKEDEEKAYLNKTGVDVLAVNVGTFHGIDTSGVSPNIRLDRLKEIRQKTSTPFVLHGGSGTPEEDIKMAIQLGIVKININTETRLAFSNTLRKTLQTNKDEITPYKYLLSAINAVQFVVEKNIKLFGSENKA